MQLRRVRACRLAPGALAGLVGLIAFAWGSPLARAQDELGEPAPEPPPSETVESGEVAPDPSALQPASAQGSRQAEERRGGQQPRRDAAVDRDRERAATRARWEANYRRNIYALQAAFGREILPGIDRGYGARIEFAMLLPNDDGASSLIAVTAGLSGWGGDQAWGLGVPLGFGLGYRTPAFLFYLGPSFGLGMDKGTEPAAGAYGGFASAGVDLGGLRLMLDGRGEYRIMKYGQSRWHLGYGAVVSLDP